MLTEIDEICFGKDYIQATGTSTFLLNGEIEQQTAQNVSEWILSCNCAEDNEEERRPESLTLFINSGGGDLHAAWQIIAMLQGSHIPVRTVAVGLLASASLLIFLAGHKKMRFMTENVTVMSHQYSWSAEGKHHELMAQVKEYDLTHKRLIAYYKKAANTTEKKVLKYFMPPQDMYYSSNEAVELGLGDAIISLS